MAKQVEDDHKQFVTKHLAYLHGILRFGSGSYEDTNCGWSIEHV